MTYEELNPKEKAAILMIALGQNYSAEIYKHLSEDELGQLTLGITTTRRVNSEIKERVLNEFYEMCLTQQFISEGGIDYARQVLEQAMGQDKARDLINRLSSSLQVRPFDFIRRADSMQILNVIGNEHPQTIALVLSYISPKQAAEVLAELPEERQTDIVRRVANMGSTSPEYVKEAERILERKLSSMGFEEQIAVGGISAIVDIINSIDRSTERNILESLDVEDAELADEIRKKLFVFEDIAKLGNSAIQRVLKEINNADLAIALKMAGEEVSKVIFSNISKRLQEMLKDDMEVMGPVRVRDVEEAQQRIVNVIRTLEESGEIIISRGEGDDLIV
ncbi:MAG: flagellar motor switch protein FliG [Oscillospiraceae bacterium]|nr:flagellar motor switch protein FliG [Oscillospiraceae bacterium]